MVLSYTRKQGQQHRIITWRDILSYVAMSKQGVTAKMVSDQFNMQWQEAGTRLKRLHSWGMVNKNKSRPCKFTVTEYGYTVATGPKISKPADLSDLENKNQQLQSQINELEAEIKSSSSTSPIEYVNAVDDVLKGPIGLQRIIDITDVDDLPYGISWIVQKKYDGWLIQYLNNQLYTRHGMNITKQFMPILSAFQKLKGAHLIGELVFFTNDNKQDKQMIGKVAIMKNIQGANKIIDEASGTYKIVLFDIIGYDGDDISDLPYKERLKILRNTIMPSKHILIVKDYPFIKENDAYQESLNEGGEGVVYKHPGQIFFWANLPKELRPVNNQYKRKKHLTDDFIIFKYDYTDKGTLRIHFGQLWKKEIIEVGTLGITKHEKKTEILNLLKHGPFVAEFKYTERYKDPPGALRDPVYLFPRLDKPIESVLLPYEYGS